MLSAKCLFVSSGRTKCLFVDLGDPGFIGLSFFHSEVSLWRLWGPYSVEAKIDTCRGKKNFQMGQCRKGSPTVQKF